MKLYCQVSALLDPQIQYARTCGGYLGKSPVDLVLCAVVRERTPRDAEKEPHKDVRPCRKCGWWNVYIRRSYVDNK